MEKRLIELEENTKRKDFTEYELSKNLRQQPTVSKINLLPSGKTK